MTKARTLADNFAADINGITAGTGITGGGTSGTVTITNDMATTIAAKGDLIIGTGNDTYSRLAVASTAGYLLSVDSAETTGLKWAAPAAAGFKGCSLYGDGDIAVNNNTQTVVSWSSERFDTDGFHSTTTNTSRITIPSGLAGKYLVQAKLSWNTENVTGRRGLTIYKNGTGAHNVAYAGTTYTGGDMSVVMDLAVSDYIQVYVYQNSGSNDCSANNAIDNGWFSVTYLGA